MAISGDRWVELTPSQFAHEAEGLRYVRERLPDAPPFRAWSNFEFRDAHGKWHEVDLLVLGRRRLHLVELKYYAGTLRGDDYRWVRDNGRAEDSPLLLARRKAQRLSSRLQDELIAWSRETGTHVPNPREAIPYVQEAVFLHHPQFRCDLPPHSRIDLFGLDGASTSTMLPGIRDRLLEPPPHDGAVRDATGQILVKLLERIGLVQRRQREAGSWIIDAEPIAEGEGWQDWPAFHRIATTDRARIRFFVSAPGAPSEERERVQRLARHEFRITSRLAHDGLLRPRDIVETELGVGLVYPRDERLQRLDLWLAGRREGLALPEALSLLRQVAEAVAYAHHHRVVHRGLTPEAVSVRTSDGQLRAVVGDWQSAGAVGAGAAGTSVTENGITTLAAARLENLMRAPSPEQQKREVFQAPEEAWRRDADRVRLDVFALGALAYYLITRRPPAANRASLRERLQRDNGLDLAADVPQVSPKLRALVLAATRPTVSDRLPDVATFLAQLDDVERLLTAPDEAVEMDPLEAGPGAVLDDRFRVERRLGAGSTAVGLLVTDLTLPDDTTAPQRVLKVALDDAAATRLADEAEVLRGLHHPRIVRLLDDPLDVGGRRALLLESAGEQTLAEVLRSRRRLSLDLLERWGTELLEAVVALDRAGVDHRDIKPGNVGIRENRSDHSKHLVLFDFSLARAGATALSAGTPPYLDPFLDVPGRGRYDSAAERYAAAVVLFEMATGATPQYGDGLSDPAAVRDEATVEAEQFDAAVATALVPFFQRALARDWKARHDTAADMLAEWRGVFVPVARTVPDDADTRAEQATWSTPLAEAGLSARALSALEPLGVETVADLIAVDPVRLNRLSGVAEATRREVKDRATRWREKLGRPALPLRRKVVPPEVVLPDPLAAARLLVERAGGPRADTRRRVAALVLGLEPGADAFASHRDLAPVLGVPRNRAQQYLTEVQQRWTGDDEASKVLEAMAATVVRAVHDLGEIATVEELADALHAVLPPVEGEELDAMRVVAGLARVAVDNAESTDPDRRFTRRRRHGQVALLATDPALLDLAEAAAGHVDDLVAELGDLAVMSGARAGELLRTAIPAAARYEGRMTDERLLQLAVALSATGALSGRGELHGRGLQQAAAVRLALSGLGAFEPVTAQEVRDRARARFPTLAPLPERPALDRLLAEAGLPLTYDEERRAYLAPGGARETSGLVSRQSTHIVTPVAAALAARGPVAQRLAESARARSFLALGVEAQRWERAIMLLRERHGVSVVDVSGVLLEAMRVEAGSVGLPWPAVRAADAKEPGTREALGLAALVTRALTTLSATIERATADGAGTPVLLTDLALLARYGHLHELTRWADLASPRQAAVWALVPQLLGAIGPVVDGKPLPLAAPGQFVRLDSDWLAAAAA